MLFAAAVIEDALMIMTLSVGVTEEEVPEPKLRAVLGVRPKCFANFMV